MTSTKVKTVNRSTYCDVDALLDNVTLSYRVRVERSLNDVELALNVNDKLEVLSMILTRDQAMSLALRLMLAARTHGL